MKKTLVTLTLLAGLAVCSCGPHRPSGDPPSGTAEPNGPAQSEAGIPEPGSSGPSQPADADNSAYNGASGAADSDGEAATRVIQGGPYGEISLRLPKGWSYEAMPVDSDPLAGGEYGISFYPDGEEDGQIRVVYMDRFGVCGTGLAEEEGTIAGCPVRIGTYDNHACWDFIKFNGDYEGIVAMTASTDLLWWKEYGDTATGILDTLSFDRDQREGGAYLYRSDSEVSEAGLMLSLTHITEKGVTLVFYQYDPDILSDDLSFGEDFTLERQKGDIWEPVPVIIEGDYAFDAVAHPIPAGETLESDLDWSPLYGDLTPGTYRISKTILMSRKGGGSDTYTITAEFLLN